MNKIKKRQDKKIKTKKNAQNKKNEQEIIAQILLMNKIRKKSIF